MASEKDRISLANEKAAAVLSAARSALCGEVEFGPAALRTLHEALDSMQSLVPHAKSLRQAHPELQPELDRYKLLLEQLAVASEQLRMFFLTQKLQMLANGSQLDAVSHWAKALRQTQSSL